MDIRKRVPVLRCKRQTNAAPMTVPIMTNVSVAVTLLLVDLHRSATVPAVVQGNVAAHGILTVIPARAVIKAAVAAAVIHRLEKHLNPALAAQHPAPVTNVLIMALPAAEVPGVEVPRLRPILGKSGESLLKPM